MDIRLICVSFVSSLLLGCAVDKTGDVKSVTMISDCEGNYVSFEFKRDQASDNFELTR